MIFSISRKLVLAAALTGISTSAFGGSIPNLEFPWKNNPTTDAVYKMSDHPNGVFVFEALALFCGYCNENAKNVDALATKYKAEPRVQVLDLSLDTSDSTIQQWIARHRPNHPVIKDVNRTAFNALKHEKGIPQVFIVNCAGELSDTVVGSWDDSAKIAIDAAIQTGLEKTCK